MGRNDYTMAQRTIHYLFGDILSKHVDIRNKKRFLVGSILPDAYARPFDRDNTHYKVKTEQAVFFDFNKFREQFYDLILADDLYLGYYMHLVEDAFYRQFIYGGDYVMPSNKDEVPLLHSDYHILNSYIVKKYGLKNILEPFENIDNQAINGIAEFIINDFIEDMSGDFTEQTTGKTHFLTEAMVDSFVDKYIPLAKKEIESIMQGHFILQACDYAWARRAP